MPTPTPGQSAGPWTAHLHSDKQGLPLSWVIRDGRGRYLGSADWNSIPGNQNFCNDPEEMKANAALIAAAPTLKADLAEAVALLRELVEERYLDIDADECETCGQSNEEVEDTPQTLLSDFCANPHCPGVRVRQFLARAERSRP